MERAGMEDYMIKSKYTGLAEAIQELKKEGFTANFELLDHSFTDVGNGRVYRPDQLAIVDHWRIEGVSDPDDMAVLYAIESTDGNKGIVVDAFGTYADPELGEFLESVPFREEPRLQAVAA